MRPRRHDMKHYLLSLLLVSTLLLGSEGKPVGIWCGRNGQRLTELIRATVLNPQWSSNKALSTDYSGKDFDSCSAVIYLMGGGSPVVWRDWNQTMIAEAERFVEKGGTLLLLIDGAINPGGKTRPFERLLGAEEWNDFSGRAELHKEWKECGNIPQVHEHMLSGKGRFAALKKLTTAKMLIGNESGAVAAENRLGKGRVLFINVRLTESLTPYTQPYNRHANAALEQFFPFARRLHAFLMEAKPALSDEKRERWEMRPLGPTPDKTPWKKATPRPVTSKRRYIPLSGTPLTLIKEGKTKALIVIGEQPGDKAGAEILNSLLQKMSGTRLPLAGTKEIKQESGKWMYKGEPFECRIHFASADEIEISVQGNDICLASQSPAQSAYAFLHEALGYRMLWPGKSGEVYEEIGRAHV